MADPAERPGDGCWLVRDGQVLASVELAGSRSARRRGLLGRDDLDGVLALPARSVHTVGMRFPIDVAFCDDAGRVLRVVTLAPNRVTRWHRRARLALEAPAGAFGRWGVVPGTTLEVR
jgi:uncharacterized membrane protein (UPF0127 family)